MAQRTYAVVATAILLPLMGCGTKSGQSPSNPFTELPLEQRIKAVAQPVVDGGWTQAMIVGVYQGGREHYFAFGSVSDTEITPPDENTIFEIGSITKVFTAIALAELAEAGTVSLDDPLSQYLPDDVAIPSPARESITLERLAAHTSGLPNIADNFWEEGDNIFDVNQSGMRWGSYSEAKLREYFQNPKLGESGTYVYSNIGMGTLGYALEQASKQSLESLIVDRVCKPLGMNSTSFSLETTVKGHDADGVPVQGWLKGESALGGAFALRSSCKDLLAFAKANLHPDASPISEALRSAMKPRAKVSDLEQTALGWKVNSYGVVYATGTTGGFRSAIFLHPQTETAVVTMVNTQVGGGVGGRAPLFDTLSGMMLNATLGGAPSPLDFPSPDSAFDGKLIDFVGTYRPEDGNEEPTFTVSVEGDRLLMPGPGDLPHQLWPKGTDEFFLRGYVATLKFRRDSSGIVTGADLQFEDKRASLKRMIEQ